LLNIAQDDFFIAKIQFVDTYYLKHLIH